MNKLAASIALCAAAVVSVPALAADPVTFDYPVYKDYVPPYIPPVDTGLKGSFYLRGSIGGGGLFAKEVVHPQYDGIHAIQSAGHGYSAGIGAGYEMGDGLRFDVTVDHIENKGQTAYIAAHPHGQSGDYSLNLRSTLALANVYYDFGLGDLGLSAAGGLFAYVGAGAGIAYNHHVSTDEPGGFVERYPGSNTSFAAAAYAGVGYDFGSIVADLGYRGIYINSIENTTAPANYRIDHALLHELRATLRYRFN